MNRIVAKRLMFLFLALPIVVGVNISHAAQLILLQDNFEMQKLLKTDLNISSCGENEAGELYVVDYRGTVYKFLP